jgi:hypothetical protein
VRAHCFLSKRSSIRKYSENNHVSVMLFSQQFSPWLYTLSPLHMLATTINQTGCRHASTDYFRTVRTAISDLCMQAVPVIPPNASSFRYYFLYKAAGARFSRVRIYQHNLLITSPITAFNFTLTRLVANTEYTIQVRPEFRYRDCFSYIRGNYTDPVTFRTTNQGKG